ncbi:MAG TPA: hypothetical protein VI358_12895 [Pseudolabrys sp.]
MPLLLNNPAHWHLRAQEARLLALHLKDPEANAAVLKIADEYDHLAVRAAQREKHECDLVAPKGITRGEVR